MTELDAAMVGDADLPDANIDDSAEPDATHDAGSEDASFDANDAAIDAANDGGQDAGQDAAALDDAGPHANPMDATIDAGSDAQPDAGADAGSGTRSGPNAPYILEMTLTPERIDRLGETQVEVVAFDPDDRDATLDVEIVDALTSESYGMATKVPPPRRDAYRLDLDWATLDNRSIRSAVQLEAVVTDAYDDFATEVRTLELAAMAAECFGSTVDILNDDDNCGSCGIGCTVVPVRNRDEGICVDGQCTPTFSECIEIVSSSADNCHEYCQSLGLTCANAAQSGVAQAYYEFIARCRDSNFPFATSGDCGRDFGTGRAVPYVRCSCTQM